MMSRTVKAGAFMPGVTEKYATMLISSGIAREESKAERQNRINQDAKAKLSKELRERLFGPDEEPVADVVLTKDEPTKRPPKNSVKTKD